MLPERGPALLTQRTPGETDLRIFTAEVIPAGRHRVDPRRPGLRVVRNRQTGRTTLRTSLLSEHAARQTSEPQTPLPPPAVGAAPQAARAILPGPASPSLECEALR